MEGGIPELLFLTARDVTVSAGLSLQAQDFSRRVRQQRGNQSILGTAFGNLFVPLFLLQKKGLPCGAPFSK